MESDLDVDGLFFTKTELLTFGGAYAVLPYVYQGAVERYQWLSGPQMMDGLASSGETTPGPLIIVGAFVGFVGGWLQQALGAWRPVAGGVAAATVVTFFTFLPSFPGDRAMRDRAEASAAFRREQDCMNALRRRTVLVGLTH